MPRLEILTEERRRCYWKSIDANTLVTSDKDETNLKEVTMKRMVGANHSRGQLVRR